MAELKRIPLEDIIVPRMPVHREPTRHAVQTMATSLAHVGLHNPITVQAAGSRYKLIDGYLRFLAARRILLSPLLCLVVDEEQTLPAACVFKSNIGWPPVWTGWSK